MQQIMKNVKIHYKNGSREIFEVVRIEKNGIYTGFLSLKKRKKTVFVDSGFIPINLIEKICSLSNRKDNLIIDFKRNIKEEKKEHE